MRIVFMGTPEFAVPSLSRLLADGHTVAAVFTQPDKPKNRGMKLTPSPVKQAALSAGIPVYQPATLKGEEPLEALRALAPELIVVAAYGKLLPKAVLEVPKLGCINVHSSLLPKYRGAAPINWAIVNGERETGVTIMCMAERLDAGDILSQAAIPIGEDETAEELHDRLAALGGELLSQTVRELAAGTAVRTPQNEAEYTYAPMLSRELSPLDFRKSARALHNQIRGLTPWPASSAVVAGREFKVYASRCTGEETDAAPGTLLRAGAEGIVLACGDGKALTLTEVQAPGKRRMAAADYLRGHPLHA